MKNEKVPLKSGIWTRHLQINEWFTKWAIYIHSKNSWVRIDPDSESKSPLLTKYLVTMTRIPGYIDTDSGSNRPRNGSGLLWHKSGQFWPGSFQSVDLFIRSNFLRHLWRMFDDLDKLSFLAVASKSNSALENVQGYRTNNPHPTLKGEQTPD